MRLRAPDSKRRGASLAEAGIVLLTFLTIILGMIDLGLGVFRYHAVSQAARQGARLAIVHGSMASATGPWGPGTYGPVPGTDPTPLAQGLAPSLAGLDPSRATVQAEWIDGGNDPDQRVQVTVRYSYQPMITFLFGSPTYTLSATSTMAIAH